VLNNQLEGAQRIHNAGTAASGNVSPSNNPRQIQIDNAKKAARGVRAQQELEMLRRGAEIIASERPSQINTIAQRMGLSEEEIIGQISLQTRAQRRKDSNVTELDVMRQMMQASKSLADVSESAELKGIAVREEQEIDPFGMMQDDSQSYSRDEKVRYGVLPDDMLTDNERALKAEGVERPVTGEAGVRDALRQLQKARANPGMVQTGLAKLFGGEVLPGSAGLEQSLEDGLQYGASQRAAEADLARRYAIADRAASGFGRNETALANEYRAAAEAEAIARDRFTAGGGGAIADEMMARIGAANAGPVGTADFNGQTYIDPRTGTPIAIDQPGNAVFAGSNTPDTHNQLNAPTRETAIDYVARQQPDFTGGGRVFGDYPQVDITGQSTMFADRVRNSGMVDPRAVPQDIRSIDEFQKAVDAISAITAEKGTRMYRRAEVGDPVTKQMGYKNIRVAPENVGPEEVMQKLRYSPTEQQAFAQALYQAEVSKNSGINANRAADYFGRNAQARGPKDDIVFSAAEAINPREGEAKVARVKAGQTIEGRDIGTAFRTLQTPGARQPFIGQVEGQAPRIDRYVGQGMKGVATEDYGDALREKEMGFARNRAKTALKKEGQPVTPMRVEKRATGLVDESGLRDKTVKAQLVSERTKRDNKARNERERAIRTRSGMPPAEPQSAGSAAGYGDQLRSVIGDAREQSADMALSEMIRRRRGR
tara:strand:+ start:528 stop:2663 length:2136 start_codon:yes stop_codon:yes gene_type:complete